jgi:hypothetical protein
VFTQVNLIDRTLVIHAEKGAAATSGFKKSSWVIDPQAHTLRIKDYESLSLPAEVEIAPDKTLEFALADVNGNLRKQRRTVVVPTEMNGPFKAAGHLQPAEARAAKMDFRIKPYKFRAYASHVGVETDLSKTGRLPNWLQLHRVRCANFWSRLAFICLDARTGKEAELSADLIRDKIKPAYDAFNNAQGSAFAKRKLRYPKVIAARHPPLSSLLGLASNLEERAKSGLPVPEGLAAEIRKEIGEYKPDYTALNAFQKTENFRKIADEGTVLTYPSLTEFQRTLKHKGILTAEALKAAQARGSFLYLPLNPESVYKKSADQIFGPIADFDLQRDLTTEERVPVLPEGEDAIPMTLRWWEIALLKKQFMAVLKARRTRNMRFYKGWPQPIKSGGDSWVLRYHLNGAKCTVADLLSPGGIKGLRLGDPVARETSGCNHRPDSRREKSLKFRPAEIRFKDTLSGEVYSFRFSVLIHREMPLGAHIKEWQLTHRDGKYHLIITTEQPIAKTRLPTDVAGVNLGWRSTPGGLKVMTLYTPGVGFEKVLLDTTSRQPKTHRLDSEGKKLLDDNGDPMPTERKLFTAYMGQSRSALRNAKNGHAAPPDVFESTEELAKLRDNKKDALKKKLQIGLSDPPVWLGKAGVQGLRTLVKSMREDPDQYTPEDLAFMPEIEAWIVEDERIGKQFTTLWAKLTGRLRNEYQIIAHQICKHLLNHGVTALALPKSLSRTDDEEEDTLVKTKKKTRENKGMLQRLSTRPGNYASEANKAASTNRQRASVSTLVQWLSHIAEEQGLTVVETPAENTTRVHRDCGHKNRSLGEKPVLVCEGCGEEFDLDENAALNTAMIGRGILLKERKSALA